MYTIYIIPPPIIHHIHVFDEIAYSLQTALIDLNFSATITTNQNELTGIPIVLGANLITKFSLKIKLPKNSIIYNLEQLDLKSPWITKEYLNLLQEQKDLPKITSML